MFRVCALFARFGAYGFVFVLYTCFSVWSFMLCFDFALTLLPFSLVDDFVLIFCSCVVGELVVCRGGLYI